MDIKRTVTCLFFILSCELFDGGSTSKEHIHFKIHVPEIVQHQIHTKVVFIHKPVLPKKPKPKGDAPKTYHKESHHEDWSSWSSYGYHNDHDDRDVMQNPKSHQADNKPHEEEDSGKKSKPLREYHMDSYMPQHNDESNHLKGQHGDMMGYSYPPQYAVREEVKEINQNSVEPYMNTYEETYQRGGESESGRTYSNDLMKYYENKHEEDGHSNEEYKNESQEKTHAGRYFVDDSEYQNSVNKYEVKKRPSRGIFVLS